MRRWSTSTWAVSPEPLTETQQRSDVRIDAAIGALAGLASGLLGVGGGFLIVPLQTLWAGIDQHRATGTSLAAILPIAMVAAATYYFATGTPQTNLPIAASLVVGGAAGVVAGTLAARRISERRLRMFVAILLLLVGLKDVFDAVFGTVQIGQGTSAGGLGLGLYLLIGICGLGIGILSGLAGLGGGVFIVPVLVIGFGISQKVAQGTSLIAVLPIAAIGAIIHHANGEVDVRAATAIAAAGVPAAIAGALLALWAPQRTLLGVFGVFLLFAAVRTWPLGSPPNGELRPRR
jgi:uncharacterized membrane protein YfcA